MARRPFKPSKNLKNLILALCVILVIGLGLLATRGLWNEAPSLSSLSEGIGPASNSELSGDLIKTPPSASGDTAGTDRLILRAGIDGQIELAQWPKDEPLQVELELRPDLTADFSVESAWIYQEDQEPLQIQTQRTGTHSIQAEVMPNGLSFGRAILELRTDEKSHFALRRFSVVFR
ncbi:MAG: hypothetical protein CL917_01300 [Deltaproteobacteria bacterium]|nr:hypothetical protein [Deltaproteobacteria bacterium]